MTHEEQLKFCQICKHRKITRQQGILCELTNEAANFHDWCRKFEASESAVVEQVQQERSIEHIEVSTIAGHTKAIDIIKGILLGSLTAIVMALILVGAVMLFNREIFALCIMGTLVIAWVVRNFVGKSTAWNMLICIVLCLGMYIFYQFIMNILGYAYASPEELAAAQNFILTGIFGGVASASISVERK